MSAYIKESLSYTAEHEWVDLWGDTGNARVGITTVATDSLGDIVFVDLPEVGAEIIAGEPCGEVESTKAVSELYAPVGGTVTAVNDAVIDDPSIINTDPYGDGWLYSVQVEDEGDLLDADEYAVQNDGEVI